MTETFEAGPAESSLELGKSPINDSVVERIRQLRLLSGIQLGEMDGLTGIPQGSYGCLELGKYRLNLENLFRILWVLGIDISEVWPRTGGLSRPRQVNEEVIAKTLRESRARQPAPLGLDDILKVVCAECAVTQKDLAGASRRRDLALARALAALMVTEQHHLSLSALARRFERCVSSLSHSLRRLRKRLSVDAVLAARVEHLRKRLRRLAEGRRRAARR